MKRYDLALFDFDGTIFDTFLGIARSSQHAMKVVMGRDYPDLDVFRQCIGPPLWDIYESAFGLTPEQAMETVNCYRERYAKLGVLECEPYDGVCGMLDRLRAAGVGCAIASSKPTPLIRTILESHQMLQKFDYIRGIEGEWDKSSKTDIVRLVIAHFGAPPERIVMVGDRFYDAEGAQNAGVAFIPALYGFGSAAEFEPYPRVFDAQTPAQVADWILGAV